MTISDRSCSVLEGPIDFSKDPQGYISAGVKAMNLEKHNREEKEKAALKRAERKNDGSYSVLEGPIKFLKESQAHIGAGEKAMDVEKHNRDEKEKAVAKRAERKKALLQVTHGGAEHGVAVKDFAGVGKL